jgi:glyoxylase-like metal-dependent hydrolase (beta-lactamase superfamily II)
LKIINLTENSKLYTSNVFLALGEWNAVDDVNTLIDVGSDEMIIKKIEGINTGLGKRKIDQVIITHNHSDHSAILPLIKETFHPKIYAFDAHLKGVDEVLKDGDKIRIGEKKFEVIHTPIHSSDSVCLFCNENGILFVGDTPIPTDMNLEYSINTYPANLIKNWAFVKTIYYGHGNAKQKTVFTE